MNDVTINQWGATRSAERRSRSDRGRQRGARGTGSRAESATEGRARESIASWFDRSRRRWSSCSRATPATTPKPRRTSLTPDQTNNAAITIFIVIHLLSKLFISSIQFNHPAPSPWRVRRFVPPCVPRHVPRRVHRRLGRRVRRRVRRARRCVQRPVPRQRPRAGSRCLGRHPLPSPLPHPLPRPLRARVRALLIYLVNL